ncbi:DUF2252 domain-containing protein, partial [Mycobacterium tuberculosis]
VFLDSYAGALSLGKARWVERDTAGGLVKELLDTLKERTRPVFLDRRSERKGRKRLIRCDGKHALEVTDAQRKRVTKLVDGFAASQANPDFFRVLDVA